MPTVDDLSEAGSSLPMSTSTLAVILNLLTSLNVAASFAEKATSYLNTRKNVAVQPHHRAVVLKQSAMRPPTFRSAVTGAVSLQQLGKKLQGTAHMCSPATLAYSDNPTAGKRVGSCCSLS